MADGDWFSVQGDLNNALHDNVLDCKTTEH